MKVNLEMKQCIYLQLTNERGEAMLSFPSVNQEEAVKLFQEGSQEVSKILKLMSQEDLADLLEFTLGVLNEGTKRQVKALEETSYDMGFQLRGTNLELVTESKGTVWSCNLLDNQVETFQKLDAENKATFGDKVPLVMHEVFDHLTCRQKDSLSNFLFWLAYSLLSKGYVIRLV